MAEFLRDRADTVQRLRELHLAVQYAEYELSAAITLARWLGLSWAEVGDALGMTKQGASQWHKRNDLGSENALRERDPDTHVEVERRRIGRLIGVGERKPRYQVRRVIAGRYGVSRVVREVVSTHVKQEVAEERCRELGAELWQLDPDGSERQLVIPPRRRRPPMGAPPPHEPHGDETPF